MKHGGYSGIPDSVVSKRPLGLGYLAGTGIAMVGALVIAAWLYAPDPETAAALLSGTVPAVALASTRYWLLSFDLSDEQIWTVALWAGLGIAVLTALNTALILVHYLVVPVVGQTVGLLASNVTIGGIGGVLVGLTVERDRDAKAAVERNSVLNRVLRHDLRNDMNVIMGRAELLAEETDGGEEHIDAIRQKADEIVAIAETARTLEDELDGSCSEPIDAAAVLRKRIDQLREAYPGARIRTDIPATAPVEADDLLAVAVGQVLENAIVHNDGEARVEVALSIHGTRTEIRVVDDGPGIPESERYPLERAEETPLEHTSGMGLWLVKWLADHYDGEVRFEAAPEGTLVCLSVPRARTGDDPDTAGSRLPVPDAGPFVSRGLLRDD